MLSLLVLFVFSFLAFSISAICGGGAGLMLIPLLGNLLPISQVPAALSIGTFSSSVSRILLFKNKICWPIVKCFVPAALPAVWLGAWLLRFVNPVYLEVVMGLFLVGNVFFLFKKNKSLELSQKPSRILLVFIGFLAGFLSGITGAVGVLFNGFYLQYGLTKEEIIATRAANEIVLHLIKIILYFLFGLLVMRVLFFGLVIALSAIISSWSMKWMLPKLSEGLFKKIGYFAMIFSGFFMLTKSSAEVLVINNGSFEFKKKEKGLNAHFNWHDASFTMEFAYDDGFEFEQVIPMSELTLEQINIVEKQRHNAEKIVVEVVYKIGSKSYEAYYFNKDEMVHKIHFK